MDGIERQRAFEEFTEEKEAESENTLKKCFYTHKNSGMTFKGKKTKEYRQVLNKQ